MAKRPVGGRFRHYIHNLRELNAINGIFQMAALAGIGAAISIALALSITSSILPPLARAVALAQSIASGKLTNPIEHGQDDELGKFLRALGDMQTSLSRLAQGLAHESHELARESKGLLDVSHNIGAAANIQAEATTSCAATIEEFSVSIAQITQSAGEAESLSAEAENLAARGQRAAAEAGGEMRLIAADIESGSHSVNELTDATHQIGSIAKVIGTIANQTNLLALNAAIEAARGRSRPWICRGRRRGPQTC